MTPEQRSLIFALCTVPGREPPISPDVFLREYGATDGAQLGLDLLRDAIKQRDKDGVALALIVCKAFGSDEPLELLIDLAFADYHVSHEDVAATLGEFRSPATVDALVHLAHWVPAYLDYDEFRALAVKAIWALGAIPDDRAHEALVELAHNENSIVAEAAQYQLDL